MKFLSRCFCSHKVAFKLSKKNIILKTKCSIEMIVSLSLHGPLSLIASEIYIGALLIDQKWPRQVTFQNLKANAQKSLKKSIFIPLKPALIAKKQPKSKVIYTFSCGIFILFLSCNRVEKNIFLLRAQSLKFRNIRFMMMEPLG